MVKRYRRVWKTYLELLEGGWSEDNETMELAIRSVDKFNARR